MRPFKLDPNALNVSTFEPATPVSATPEVGANTAGTLCTRAYQSCVWACLPTEDVGCTRNNELTCAIDCEAA